MDQTHIHLLITHLPIFGSLLGAMVLAHGLFTKSHQTKIAAYNVFIISAIGAGIAYFTGEGAEESVEHLPGVVESAIEQHDDFALYALISLIALGVASVLGLFFTIKNSAHSHTVAVGVLVLALISFGLVARTGYLGGQIRHTEISGTAVATQQPDSAEKDGDD